MLKSLLSLCATNHDAAHQRLNRVLSIASKIADRNPDALKELVRLLGRKLQSDYMCRIVTSLSDHGTPILEPRLVWFDECAQIDSEGRRIHELKTPAGVARTVRLSSDIVLPWPWKRESVVTCLSLLGEDRHWGAWEQDSNHQIEYWLPFGIAWVHGGNHSIMTGIVRGEGEITANQVYDLSGLFPFVRFNGHAFIRQSDGKAIHVPNDFEFAAIFEVGRLMHERGISA